MVEYSLDIQKYIDPSWIHMAPLYLGEVPPGLGTPDLYVKVEKSCQPFLLANIYASCNSSLPPQSILWGDWLFVGYCEGLHVVSLRTKQTVSYEINWYCSGFYPLEEFLLVMTSANILCFDKNARLLWVSEEVGLDGVIVQDVIENKIKGSGEWDPPGGWKDFELDLATGKVIRKND